MVWQVDAATELLASAHVPLVVMGSAALAGGTALPKLAQVGDVAGLLALRAVVPLLAGAGATFLADRAWTTFIAASCVVALCPAPSQVRPSEKKNASVHQL